MNNLKMNLKDFGELQLLYDEHTVIINKLFTMSNPITNDLPNRLLNPFSMDCSLGLIEKEDMIVEKIDQFNDTIVIFYRIKEVILYEIYLEINYDLGIVTRKDVLKNNSNKEIVLRQFLNKYYFEDGHYEVYNQNSSWCKENIGSWEKLQSMYIESEGARTTQGHPPYFVLRNDKNEAIAFHIKPIGNFEMKIQKATLGVGKPNQFVYECKLGLRSKHLALTLLPNEVFNGPEVIIQSIPSGQLRDSTSYLHQYLLKEKVKDPLTHKVVYNTWFDQFDLIDQEQLTKNLIQAKELGCEMFVVDAGWFGNDDYGWWDSIGDWRERKTTAFKGRMKEFSDLVRSLGLEFGLWIEPERIAKHAPIVKEHPNYLLKGNGFFYPKLNEEVVLNHIYQDIEQLIKTYHLKWIKWDFNYELGEDPTGTNFYAYYKGFYHLLEKLKKSYPQVFLEGCASGGLRNDLNTVSHYDGYFLCDNVNPYDTLLMYHHAIMRLDPYKIIKWTVVKTIHEKLVTPSGTGAGFDETETVDIHFATLVSMLGMPGFSGNYTKLSSEESKIIKENIKNYKRYRYLLQNSFVYSSEEPKQTIDEYSFLNFQFKECNRDEMVIFSFKLNTNQTHTTFYLKDMNENLNYLINEEIMIKGKDLMNGLKIVFNNDEKAKLLYIKSV